MNARLLIHGEEADIAQGALARGTPGAAAHVVTSTADALVALARGGFDAVVLGVRRLNLDALALVSRLRVEARAVPVVVLTAAEDREAARDALRLGAQDCLVRPDADTLLRAIDHAIERARLSTRLESAIVRLRGRHDFVVVCAWCRKLRDTDEWVPLEQYLARQHVQPSHGICPECSAAVHEPAPRARPPRRRHLVPPATRVR